MTKSRLTPSHADRSAAMPPLPGRLEDMGIRVLSGMGAACNAILGPRGREKFAILMYHRISEPVAAVEKPTINVPPTHFYRQIRGLLDRGYVFWPLEKVLEWSAAGKPFPPGTTVLTFDDGFEGIHQNVWPLLREKRIPATIFLSTAFLDQSEPFPFDPWAQRHAGRVPPESYRPLRTSQCLEMAESGLIDFGAHSHTHQDFRSRLGDFRRDLGANVEILESLFGKKELPFAFPYGTPRLGFASADLVAAARSVGVSCGLTTQAERVDPGSDPFTWGRFNAFAWDNGATLSARISGWYGWAPKLRHRDRPACRPRAAQVTAGPSESFDRSCAAPATPFISVVVPTFNRADWLGEALATLADQHTDGEFEYEIIVVDNGSQDHTRQVVEDFSTTSPVEVRYAVQHIPGDAPTRNCGIGQSRGQWLAFFDDDQLADPQWLAQLYRTAKLTRAGVVGGPVQLDLSDRLRRRLGPICRRALREVQFYDRVQRYSANDLPGAGNALVARAVFDEIGEFAMGMSGGGSDCDFFTRAREAGFSLWYTPHAVIRHRVSPGRLTPEYFRWDALSGGAGHAGYFDYQKRGRLALACLCLARVSQAILIHVPLLWLGWLRGDQGQVLGRKTRLWRTEGYVRKTLAILAPSVFGQKSFFRSLDFRQSRNFGG